MDRYRGADYGAFNAEEIAEAEALEALAYQQLLDERRQWEGDRDAIAEYESWIAANDAADADAQDMGVRHG
jgi:hypothetical protein